MYQEKLKAMLMHIFWGVANECIPRDVQLLGNMLIVDVELWGVEEATPLTIVLKVKNDRRLKDKSLYHRRTNLGFC